MLNKRQEKIIMLLQNSKSWITGKEIAKLMNVSDRTIRSDVGTINRYYEDALIKSDLRSGYCINEEVMTRVPIESNSFIPQTPAERCVYIIQELLFERQEINLLDLQEQVYVSGYSIENDIKHIKKTLEPYEDLKLLRFKNHIHLAGSEESKRKLYKQLLFKETQGNFLNLNVVSTMFHDFDFLQVKRSMDAIFAKYNYHVREMAMPMLMIHVGIAIERMLHHNYIETNRASEALKQRKEYIIMKEFFTEISKHIRLEVNNNEVILLALLLIGKKAVTLQSDLMNASIEMKDINVLVEDIIAMIKNDFDIDFSKDLDLRTGLLLHLQGLIERKDKNVVISNLYLEELKRKYPLIFELAIQVGQLLHKRLAIQISEDELGFIALHLGVAYERAHTLHKYRVVMIYPVDQAFGDILLKKIENLFSDRIIVVQCTSFFEECRMQELHPDLILTTLQLQHRLDIATVQISLFINTEDESKIFQTLNALDKKRFQKQFEEELMDLIEPTTFFSDLPQETPQEVITFMCDHLESLGYCDHRFKESVLKRESMAATSFVYSFAVPHALNVASFKSVISIGFLKNPIPWGEFEVHMVLLLAVNEEHRDLLLMFFEWLSGMINNANHFAALLETTNYDDFIRKIIQ